MFNGKVLGWQWERGGAEGPVRKWESERLGNCDQQRRRKNDTREKWHRNGTALARFSAERPNANLETPACKMGQLESVSL
jgi:hypothetical protein